MKPKLSLLGPILVGLMLTACERAPQDGVDLSPNDPRPIFSIAIADQAEVEILMQQLKLEPVYVRDGVLYFYEDPDITGRLRELGYTPKASNPYEVFERVVRIDVKGDERELSKTGVLLINRERDYWVVRGSLAQLTVLQRIGYRISPVGADEPRPREVKIQVANLDSVQEVYAAQVDVYTVQEEKRGYAVYGGAFDRQIDQLRDKGYEVELISTLGEGGQQ